MFIREKRDVYFNEHVLEEGMDGYDEISELVANIEEPVLSGEILENTPLQQDLVGCVRAEPLVQIMDNYEIDPAPGEAIRKFALYGMENKDSEECGPSLFNVEFTELDPFVLSSRYPTAEELAQFEEEQDITAEFKTVGDSWEMDPKEVALFMFEISVSEEEVPISHSARLFFRNITSGEFLRTGYTIEI
jgi:hypothetical protein